MDSSIAIEANNLSKKYRLGTIGMSSLREDLSRWWGRKKQNASTEINTKTAGIDQSRMINDSEFWALHDLNFKIQKGEVVGLIGANGSGKSTLLKILSRITEPTEGEVRIRGKVASLLEVGTGFHPELTGRENVYINGAILGMTRKEVDTKFDEIIDFAGVADFIDTPIKRYSSGMTVRLGFAVAAHLDPDILIVDEVLAVGDAAFQKKCIGRMNDIAELGRTVLFVSHNMASIDALCSKGILLKNGKIRNSGKISSIISEYLSDLGTFESKDISERSDRVGSGEIKLQKILLFDQEMVETTQLISGRKCFIKFIFNQFSNYNQSLDFGVGIDNANGQRITTLSSTFMGVNFRPADLNFITIKFPKLSLSPGEYKLTTFLGKDEKPCDWITNAFSFKVHSGDYYGFGNLPTEGQGNVLSDFQMSCSG